MRNTIKFTSLAILLIIAGTINTTVAKAAETPEQTAKNFYEWYLKEIAREHGNPLKQKQVMLKAVSKRLGKWIYSPAYSEYGADYIIDAQDFDENWNVTTTKAVIKGDLATLKVLLALPNAKKSDFKQTLALKMLKEDGLWKIDSINNRKLL